MKEIILNKPFVNDEEYFLFEEKSELKHEYINSTLFEMGGAPKFHNKFKRKLANLLEQLVDSKIYEVYDEGFKVRTPDGNFLYPDALVCFHEPERYYTRRPILVIEVLCDSTRAYDLSDKFIQYRKCPRFEYYLCIEPEKKRIFFFSRNENREWLMEEADTEKSANINLPKLNISIAIKDIYQS